MEREGIHQPLVFRELFDKVQNVLDAHSSGGERSWKHDHYLKGTLVCAECGSRLYYAVAKGRFGYFRCIGRNTGRTRCSQGRYVPAADLEREVEALYEGVSVPAALRRRLERVLRTEVAERERHRAEATQFLGRRLRQLANEREKLLRAYYADAIDVATLKREQARINAEVAEAESQLANDGEKLAQAKTDHRPRARSGEGLRRELSQGQARRPQDVEPRLLQHDPRSGRRDRRRHVRGALRVSARFTQGLDGGPKGIRTPDLLAASQTLYQLSYGPAGAVSLANRPRPGP